jgi:hypothetical protein
LPKCSYRKHFKINNPAPEGLPVCSNANDAIKSTTPLGVAY